MITYYILNNPLTTLIPVAFVLPQFNKGIQLQNIILKHYMENQTYDFPLLSSRKNTQYTMKIFWPQHPLYRFGFLLLGKFHSTRGDELKTITSTRDESKGVDSMDDEELHIHLYKSNKQHTQKNFNLTKCFCSCG